VQRVGAIYLLLTLAGCGGAIALAYGYRLGTVTAASAMLPSLATVYLAWASFRADRNDVTLARSMTQIADDLAEAVAAQWHEEARAQRAHDPYPLPLAWTAAPAALVEQFPTLRAMATAWPTRPGDEPAGWARDPGELDGHWEQIADVLTRRVPTRRLLVLGESGSGKTTLLIHLIQQLLYRRADRGAGPIPVLLPLASFRPAQQELADWITARLERDYPALARAAAAPRARISQARALWEHALILPVLDGLDELPEQQQPAALEAVNRALAPGQPMVISSRSREYRAACEHAGIVLAGTAGIELQPVTPAAAVAYLTYGNARTAARWSLIAERLGAADLVARALRTPQMLFLARTIYSTRPGEPIHSADPAELLDTARFPTARAIEQHLLRGFIPALYLPGPHTGTRVTLQSAQRTLAFLAAHAQDGSATGRDLAWWQLPRHLPRRPLTVTLWASLAAGAALRVTIPAALSACTLYGLLDAARHHSLSQLPQALTAALSGAVVSSTVCAAAAALTLALRRRDGHRAWTAGLIPLHSVRWHWNTPAIALALTTATLAATAAAVLLTGSAGLLIAAPLGVTAVIWGGLRTDAADPAAAGTPASLLAREQSAVQRNGVAFATLGAVTIAALYALSGPRTTGYGTALLTGTITGALVGLFAGLFGRLADLASWSFTATRHYLAWRHQLPRDLMAFLADAHQHRGVKRQIAGVYQFRHPDLQHLLTDTTTPVTQTPDSTHPQHDPP
jgi:hypothetical protein